MARKSVPFSASTGSGKPAKPKNKSAKKLDPSNAYTYLPELPKRHRTSAFQNSLTHDELEDSKTLAKGRGQDENEDSMAARVRRVAMMIAGDEPQEVEEEESDIDSDAAWESGGSDEERWGDIFRQLDKGKGKKKAKEAVLKPAKPLTINLDESEDEAPKSKSKKAKAPIPEPEADDEEEDEDLDPSEDEGAAEEDSEDELDEDEFASDDELPSDLSDDDQDPKMLEGLDDFVDQLAAADKKRKATGDEEEGKGAVDKKKRKVLSVKAGAEIKEDAALRSNQKLDLADLISSHPSLAGASSLLKSGSSSNSILKQGTLAAPLPTVQQERLDREAAYAQTKSEGQKWAGVMKRVKEAEHLSFPLQAKERGGLKSANEVLAGWKPQNEMESAVESLLKKANLTEDELKKQEDLQMEAREMTDEEIKDRRAQLRYQRELLFRAEAKAKRVSKIKSKTFRKLARKRAAKDAENGLSLEELERLDPEAAEVEREKIERARALERATLRHGAKNRWAKDIGGGNEDEDQRMAKEKMLDMKERLMRKIHGRGEGSSEEEESEEDEDDDEETLKTKAFDQLASLSSGAAMEAAPEKGLMSMKFMQKAQERRMKEVAELEKDALQQIKLFGEEKEQGSENESGEEEPDMINIGGNEGRMKYAGPTPGKTSETAPVVPQTAIQARKSALSRPRSPSPTLEPVSNPWLTATSSSGPSRKKNTQQGAQLSGEVKAVKAVKKASKRREEEEEDERVDIDVDAPVAVAKAPPQPAKGNAKGKKSQTQTEAPEDDGEDADIADLLPSGMKAFKQRDLVAEAFAGDNVVEDFAAEKARQVEADAPKMEDTSLPGWGAWTGKGTKKRKTNPKFLLKTQGVEPALRKDFANSNVIISEKKDKKAASFQLKDLPFPYTSKEQYEKSFDMPVGSEWNSRGGFQKGTLPRVVKKPGAIIEPVRRLF